MGIEKAIASMIKMNRFSWQQHLAICCLSSPCLKCGCNTWKWNNHLVTRRMKATGQEDGEGKTEEICYPNGSMSHHLSYGEHNFGFLIVWGNIMSIWLSFRLLNSVLTDKYVSKVSKWVMTLFPVKSSLFINSLSTISFISHNIPTGLVTNPLFQMRNLRFMEVVSILGSHR